MYCIFFSFTGEKGNSKDNRREPPQCATKKVDGYLYNHGGVATKKQPDKDETAAIVQRTSSCCQSQKGGSRGGSD